MSSRRRWASRPIGAGAARIIARNGGNAFTEPLYFGQYYDVPPITEAVGRVKRVLNVADAVRGGLKETLKWYTKQSIFSSKDEPEKGKGMPAGDNSFRFWF
jgi:hypothetical protein